MFSPEYAQYKKALDEILPTVEKPVRYMGGEYNAIRKSPASARVRVALCLPDTYEIGMSHLGLKILYSILNRRPDIAAERVFTPWVDMEAALRARRLPLVSLETYTPIRDFDVLGFSLQYEMQYTNVLTVLDLSGIPLRASERALRDPLVVGGGPLVFSPEPIADFFDLFLIGDGEELLVETVDRYIELKAGGGPREQIIRELARIPGVYAPALYTASTVPEHGLEVVNRPEDASIPFPIKRRIVEDINKYPFPSDSPVPYADVVHDRIAVEIARGCVDGCRFCQAGTIYRPVRERKPEDVARTIIEGIKKCGYDESSLTSLSTADYTCLTPLLKELNKQLAEQKVSLSVSSLRASGLTKELSQEIARVRHTGFTIAPEAGSQRMRDVINKNITEDDVMRSCANAFSNGWTQIKLYFMIGLPSETDEDVRGIAELGRKVQQLGRKFGKSAKVTVSVSSHVPKPHTPFQWCKMDSIAEIKRKQGILRELCKRYHLNLRLHNPEISRLEGIISRGDRRMSRVVERAWRAGCRFDGWDEQFRYQTWMKAFEEEGIDPEIYLELLPVYYHDDRRAGFVPLPWDHIDTAVTKEFLAQEYNRGLKAKIAPPCGFPVKVIDGRPTAIPPSWKEFENLASRPLLCYDCGLDCDLEMMRQQLLEAREMNRRATGLEQPLDDTALELASSEAEMDSNVQLGTAPPTDQNAKLNRYRASFTKLEPVKFLSHLDLTRAIPRGFRRAGIQLGYSQGFHPMPLISYGPALGVGVVGEEEFIDFSTAEEFTADQFLPRINSVMPEGLKFTGLVKLSEQSPSLAKAINRAEFSVPLDCQAIVEAVSKFSNGNGASDRAIHEKLISDFMSRNEVLIEREKDKKVQSVDVRRSVVDLRVEENGKRELRVVIALDAQRIAKPTEVLGAVYSIGHEAQKQLISTVRRTRLYFEQSGHALSPLELA